MITIKSNPKSFDDSGLNWECEIRDNNYPIFCMDEQNYVLDKDGNRIVDKEQIGIGYASKNIVRTDTQVCLGTMKSQYTIIQNSATWDALHEALAGVKFDIINSGYTLNGQKTFIQAKVDGDDFKIDGEKYTGYLTIWNSHDGSIVCKLGSTYVRIVCSNTFNESFRSTKNTTGNVELKVRHTSNASIQFSNMMEILEQRLDHRKAFMKNIEQLANTPISDNNAKLFALGYMNSSATRSQNKAEQIHKLFRKGQGNKGKNLYDLFNGFTEFYTHGDLSVKRDKKALKKFKQDQWRSSEVGASAKVKSRVFNQLLNTSAVENTIAKGKILRKEIAKQS